MEKMSARPPLRRICVFCGSRTGHDPVFAESTVRFARSAVARGYGIVYGGGNIGLMGVLADAVLEAGGEVTGVIPRSLLEKELAHPRATAMHVVGSMHERKALMADLSQAFVALPGGFGTLDELCEILTWAQLRIHAKPCALLNVKGYYDPLLAMFDRAVDGGFLGTAHRALVRVADTAEAVLEKLEEDAAAVAGKREEAASVRTQWMER